MSHELAEKTAGLASRVNNLAVNQTGIQSRQLLQEMDRLIELQEVAIIQDLKSEQKDYAKAIDGLNRAIKAVEDADKDITKVSDAIKRVKQAIDLTIKAIEAAAVVAAI